LDSNRSSGLGLATAAAAAAAAAAEASSRGVNEGGKGTGTAAGSVSAEDDAWMQRAEVFARTLSSITLFYPLFSSSFVTSAVGIAGLQAERARVMREASLRAKHEAASGVDTSDDVGDNNNDNYNNNDNDDDDERSPTMRWGNPTYSPPKPPGTSPRARVPAAALAAAPAAAARSPVGLGGRAPQVASASSPVADLLRVAETSLLRFDDAPMPPLTTNRRGCFVFVCLCVQNVAFWSFSSS
jgi:hypothetical protein